MSSMLPSATLSLMQSISQSNPRGHQHKETTTPFQLQLLQQAYAHLSLASASSGKIRGQTPSHECDGELTSTLPQARL